MWYALDRRTTPDVQGLAALIDAPFTVFATRSPSVSEDGQRMWERMKRMGVIPVQMLTGYPFNPLALLTALGHAADDLLPDALARHGVPAVIRCRHAALISSAHQRFRGGSPARRAARVGRHPCIPGQGLRPLDP
jgi:hypothetical protein